MIRVASGNLTVISLGKSILQPPSLQGILFLIRCPVAVARLGAFLHSHIDWDIV